MIHFSVYTYHVITIYLDMTCVPKYTNADYAKYRVNYNCW